MLHFDTGTIQNWEKTPDGFLRVMGTPARVGWLLYQNADGSQRWEYASPEAIFNPTHLDSIGGAPLTLGHPKEKVTPKNWKQYSIGAAGTKVIARQDSGLIDVLFIVADEEAIASIESGQTTELSMGYDCLTKERNDGRFDQIKRTCNHNSLVTIARAGREAKLHLDGWLQIGFDQASSSQVFDLKKRKEDKWQILTVTV